MALFFLSQCSSAGMGLVRLRLQAWGACASRIRTKATVAAAAAVPGAKRLKSFDDLPGPSSAESMYWLFVRGYILRMHELQVIQNKMYGPLWHSDMREQKSVSIASPEMIETVLRQEGKYPSRGDMALWKEHRDSRQLAYGPLTYEGHQWHSIRSTLNKKMLKPKEVMCYSGAISDVVSDLITRIQEIKVKSPSRVNVDDVAQLLYKFAFESIFTVLFEARVGCLEKTISPEAQTFINSVSKMLENALYLEFLPKWTRGVLPHYKNFLEAWDTIFAYGKKMIDKKVAEIQARLDSGKEIEGEYLTYLLSNGALTTDEVCGSVGELLMAGVDTTSNTLSWALYLLAKNPEVQNTLYKEIVNVVPGNQMATAEEINQMPLLKAVIKETLRMYPVVPMNARLITETDVLVGDYCFPRNTHFVMCNYALSRDETNFPEPERFLPERWLRDRGITHHPFSSIPFGYGVRGCLGRRVAELEMHLALSRIIQMFKVVPDPNLGEVKARFRFVLVSNKPINLQFIDREQK